MHYAYDFYTYCNLVIYLISSSYFGIILQWLLYHDSYIHNVLTCSEKTKTRRLQHGFASSS